MIARRVLTLDVRACFDKVAAHVNQFRCGSAPIDDAEVHAFRRASALPPPPPDLNGNPVTLVMPITYKSAR